ncbi:MAG TPA: Hsp20/alpha crystallin family protein [Ktedonobacteraceae bacterium]|nr:Hsp20/alpha crystallin family protein [Ktedonobacteraceae bacterium]
MQEKPIRQHIPVKMYRSEDRLTVVAPMPGLEPADIHVEVTGDGHLILAGQVRGLLKGVKELLVDEWTVGDYLRAIALPDAVDGERANVTYGNGVVTVDMPLSQQMRPAHLVMKKVGTNHGERVGNFGHPPV